MTIRYRDKMQKMKNERSLDHKHKLAIFGPQFDPSGSPSFQNQKFNTLLHIYTVYDNTVSK
jgi:hypothetical protein